MRAFSFCLICCHGYELKSTRHTCVRVGLLFVLFRLFVWILKFQRFYQPVRCNNRRQSLFSSNKWFNLQGSDLSHWANHKMPTKCLVKQPYDSRTFKSSNVFLRIPVTQDKHNAQERFGANSVQSNNIQVDFLLIRTFELILNYGSSMLYII